MKARKIFFCSTNRLDEGAPHPLMAAFWLKARGYDVTLLCRGEVKGEVFENPLGRHSVRCFDGGQLGSQMGLLRELVRARLTRGLSPIFYVHGHAATPAALIGLLGVPQRRVIYHTQDFLEPGRHPHWEFFERRFARRAGWVISNEPNRARFMASHYRLKQMPTVVRTALPRDWPLPDRDQTVRNAILARIGRKDSENCRLVMHEGGYSPVRCGWELVEAFRRLPDCYVLVFTGMEEGGKAYALLKEHLSRAGLCDRVVILQRLPFADLLRHTACCDIGVLLYPNDGVGNFYQCPGRLSHYIGCGLPVIVSNFPALELLVLKHNLGALCDPRSPEQIAAALQKVGSASRLQLAEHAVVLRQLGRSELAYETDAWRIEQIVQQALQSAK